MLLLETSALQPTSACAQLPVPVVASRLRASPFWKQPVWRGAAGWEPRCELLSGCHGGSAAGIEILWHFQPSFFNTVESEHSYGV